MFLSNYGMAYKIPAEFTKYKMSIKANAQYADVKDLANSAPKGGPRRGKRKASEGAENPANTKKLKKTGLSVSSSALQNANDDGQDLGALANEVVVNEASQAVASTVENSAMVKYQDALPAEWRKSTPSA